MYKLFLLFSDFGLSRENWVFLYNGFFLFFSAIEDESVARSRFIPFVQAKRRPGSNEDPSLRTLRKFSPNLFLALFCGKLPTWEKQNQLYERSLPKKKQEESADSYLLKHSTPTSTNDSSIFELKGNGECCVRKITTSNTSKFTLTSITPSYVKLRYPVDHDEMDDVDVIHTTHSLS